MPLLGSFLMLAGSLPAAVPSGLDLVFERLNGTYENLVAEVEPIRSGPLTVRLSSPEHRLDLESHRLALVPFDRDLHDFRATMAFAGAGRLTAELDLGGFPTTIEDRVEFPQQEVVIEGRARIEPREDGYLIVTEQLPSFVEIEIRSELGQQLVAWCNRLALFVAGGAGCAELDQRLTRARLPLPPPGESMLVPADQLTAEERARIDLYLADF